MKSIGILTYHYPINYGAVLQTYALYCYIRTVTDGDVTVVNYVPKNIKSGFFLNIRSVKDFVHNLVVLIFIIPLLSKKLKFKCFLRSYLNLTPRYSTYDKIEYGKYDAVVTGSDQVFSPDRIGNIAYYQPFKKECWQKKIAFSPSFGIHEFTDDVEAKISQYISDFDYISCREECGAEFISKIRNETVLNTIDPVFLLDQKEWNNICYHRPTNRNYILIYDLNGKENLIKIAKRICNGKDIIIISSDPLAKIKYMHYGITKIIIDAGIEDFVTYIKYADAIVTDSFHGTAMAIIFRKNFYSFIALKNASSRIYSLLDKLALFKRIVKYPDRVCETEIQYNEKLISDWIYRSKQFLNEALS